MLVRLYQARHSDANLYSQHRSRGRGIALNLKSSSRPVLHTAKPKEGCITDYTANTPLHSGCLQAPFAIGIGEGDGAVERKLGVLRRQKAVQLSGAVYQDNGGSDREGVRASATGSPTTIARFISRLTHRDMVRGEPDPQGNISLKGRVQQGLDSTVNPPPLANAQVHSQGASGET